MNKILYTLFALLTYSHAICQRFMTVLPDSSGIALPVENIIGIKLFAADNGIKTLNQDIHFSYTSQSNGYVMAHDMNVKGLNNIPGIGIGLEETFSNQLFLNFLSGTAGYYNHTFIWTAASGVGYSFPVTPKKNLVIRAYVNFGYENISYGLGSYSDSTLIGFEVNGAYVGTYIKNIKYINNCISLTPSLDIVYRAKWFDLFAGADYNKVLFYRERLNFYTTRIVISDGLYDQQGKPVTKGAILPGNYILHLGIMFEFGL